MQRYFLTRCNAAGKAHRIDLIDHGSASVSVTRDNGENRIELRHLRDRSRQGFCKPGRYLRGL